MITAASNSLFLPRGDVSAPTGDSFADQSLNFFSLLLAFFPPGVPHPQVVSTQTLEALPDGPEFLSDLPPDEDALLELGGNSEESFKDSPSPLRDAPVVEQGLLLSFLAPFLQGTNQPIVDVEENPRLVSALDSQSPTPAQPQAVLQENAPQPQFAAFSQLQVHVQDGEHAQQDLYVPPVPLMTVQTLGQAWEGNSSLSSAIAADAATTVADAESITTIPQMGNPEINPVISSPSSSRSATPAPLAAPGEEQQSNGAPLSVPEQMTITSSRLGAADRGAVVRRYATFAGGGERKASGNIPSPLEPLVADGQAASRALIPGTQEAEVINAVEEGNTTRTATGDSRQLAFSGVELKEPRVTEQTKNAASQSEADLLTQQAEKGAPSEQTGQFIAGFSSRGKTTKPFSERALFSPGAEVFAMSSPGSRATVATQSQPEGTPHASYLESWRQILDQVGEGIISNMQPDNREARLQLTPPELGKLDIQLIVEGKHIRAHIVAESADVGVLIQSHLSELKHALQNHRLDLDTVRIEVQTGGGEPNTFSQQSRQDERSRDHGRALPFTSEAAPEVLPVRHSSVTGGPGGRVSVWA